MGKRPRPEIYPFGPPGTPVITVWGIVPNHGEAFFLDAPAEYARYYGQDVTYWQRGGVYIGRPSFVALGLVADSVSNSAARRNAEALAREQWREWQVSRVFVSNQRIVCSAGGRNLSFYFNATSGLYADLASNTLVVEFESAEPLMLHGIYVAQSLSSRSSTHMVNKPSSTTRGWLL